MKLVNTSHRLRATQHPDTDVSGDRSLGHLAKNLNRLEQLSAYSKPLALASFNPKAVDQMHLLSDNQLYVDLDMVEAMTGVAPELLLNAYEAGQFPMAEHRDADTLSWIEPSERGVIRLDSFRVPKRLARTLRSTKFSVTCNIAFDAVVESCGASSNGREDTWINSQIRVLYGALHRLGFAHSIEVWDQSSLVGGLYGISLHGTFFGESMFSVKRDASKIALVHLAARMDKGKMSLMDCQFYTRHLGQFGAIEIPQESYLNLLEDNQDTGAWFNIGLTPQDLNDFVKSRAA